MKKTDHVKAAISEWLAPLLKEAGFHRRKPKEFVRARAGIVQTIKFGMSRYGDQQFQVFRYVNLLSDPFMNIDSFRIGAGFHRSPHDDVEWGGASEEAATLAMHSVAAFVRLEMLPWLDSFVSPRDYAFEYVAHPETKIDSIQLAIAILLSGSTARPWWSCEALKDRKAYRQPFDEHDQDIMDTAIKLQAAIDDGSCHTLLAQWRDRNIAAFKLENIA